MGIILRHFDVLRVAYLDGNVIFPQFFRKIFHFFLHFETICTAGDIYRYFSNKFRFPECMHCCYLGKIRVFIKGHHHSNSAR